MMDASEKGPDDEDLRELQSAHRRNSQGFLVLLGSVGSIILLGILLNLQLDSFTRVMLLMSLFGLILLAIIVMERRRSVAEAMQDQPEQDQPEQDQPGDEDRREAPEPMSQDATEQLTDFEQLVQEALNSIPEEFHERMTNLVVIVEDEPDRATLVSAGVAEGHTLLGLYHGVPLTSLGYPHTLMPERITLYQHSIERYCGDDPERIRAQVHATLLHEVAHHFGISHEAMPIWVR